MGVRALGLSFLMSSGGESSSLVVGVVVVGAEEELAAEVAIVLERLARGEVGAEGGLCGADAGGGGVVDIGVWSLVLIFGLIVRAQT